MFTCVDITPALYNYADGVSFIVSSDYCSKCHHNSHIPTTTIYFVKNSFYKKQTYLNKMNFDSTLVTRTPITRIAHNKSRVNLAKLSCLKLIISILKRILIILQWQQETTAKSCVRIELMSFTRYILFCSFRDQWWSNHQLYSTSHVARRWYGDCVVTVHIWWIRIQIRHRYQRLLSLARECVTIHLVKSWQRFCVRRRMLQP